MKTLKTLTLLLFITIVACSKNDDNTSSLPPQENPIAISSIGPTTGPKNTQVVLTGRGFSDNAASNIVTLNGKTCTVNQASTTLLNIIIPPAAGTGVITVAVAGKSAQSNTFTFIETVTVSTLAGSTSGFADNIGTLAKFDTPKGVCTDFSGNVFVADRFNERIRKIDSTGEVITIAGGAIGFTDGLGILARFNKPLGVAVDANGNVYVADADNNKIRKINTNGQVTTLAGSTAGFTDGTGTTAQFNFPFDICVDAAGNLFVADRINNRIRKISPTGLVTTLAGSTDGFADGTGNTAQFSQPTGVCVDDQGNAYVTDGNNFKIRKISPTGLVTTLAGSTAGFADGTTTTAQFQVLSDICLDDKGNILVLDNKRIRKITPAGVVTTILDGNTYSFGFTPSLTINRNGVLYVSDRTFHKIYKIVID
jgi:serine/threonine protein kinase, bacterial